MDSQGLQSQGRAGAETSYIRVCSGSGRTCAETRYPVHVLLSFALLLASWLNVPVPASAEFFHLLTCERVASQISLIVGFKMSFMQPVLKSTGDAESRDVQDYVRDDVCHNVLVGKLS